MTIPAALYGFIMGFKIYNSSNFEKRFAWRDLFSTKNLFRGEKKKSRLRERI